jgi:hypothetical protein
MTARPLAGPLATVNSGQPRLLRSIETSSSAALTSVRHTPSKLELSSSSLHDCLGRVFRIKAMPLRGRFESLDTSVTARGRPAMRRTGEEGRHDRCTSAHGRHAISVPLAMAPNGKIAVPYGQSDRQVIRYNGPVLGSSGVSI